MSVTVALLTLVLLAVVILFISAPLRAKRGSVARGAAREQTERRQDLEAARESKYREIRDSELDYRTGKLSIEDYKEVDRSLRGEALAILDHLQALDFGMSTEQEQDGSDGDEPPSADRQSDGSGSERS